MISTSSVKKARRCLALEGQPSNIRYPTIREDTLQIKESTPGWADDIIKYLEIGDPPSREEARKVKRKVIRFTIVDGILYR